QVERLKTAVAETAMNAIEHGNKYQASLPVDVEVLLSEHQVIVRISDQGGGTPIPAPQVPDLKAKLAGRQSPRGWGLFLARSMVDDMAMLDDGLHRTVELILSR